MGPTLVPSPVGGCDTGEGIRTGVRECGPGRVQNGRRKVPGERGCETGKD